MFMPLSIFLQTILLFIVMFSIQNTRFLIKSIYTSQFFIRRGLYLILYLFIWILYKKLDISSLYFTFSSWFFTLFIALGIIISVESLKHTKNYIVLILLLIGYISHYNYDTIQLNYYSIFKFIITIIFSILTIYFFSINIKNRIGILLVIISLILFFISKSFVESAYKQVQFPFLFIELELWLLIISLFVRFFINNNPREVISNSENNFFYLSLLTFFLYLFIYIISSKNINLNVKSILFYSIPLFSIISYFNIKDKYDKNENKGIMIFGILLLIVLIGNYIN